MPNFAFAQTNMDKYVNRVGNSDIDPVQLKNLDEFQNVQDSEDLTTKKHTGYTSILIRFTDGSFDESQSYAGARPPHR